MLLCFFSLQMIEIIPTVEFIKFRIKNTQTRDCTRPYNLVRRWNFHLEVIPLRVCTMKNVK